MVDSFNFLSVADLNPIRYPFKSVFQFRPYGAVFDSVPTFVHSMGWNKIFFATETFHIWERTENAITKGLQQFNITAGGSGKIVRPNSATVPDYSFFLSAAMDLKSKDARVVVILSAFPTMVSCALYDAGMVGPKYVFLWEGVMYFHSNERMKPPHCTQHSLAEILRSSIFIAQATPMNLDPDFEDALGMTPRKLEALLEQQMKHDRPEHLKSWFQWRATFYTELVGTALVLDKANDKLRSMGSSIGEWLTDGDNFQNNATFIRNLLFDEFSRFKYKGLNTYGREEITKMVREVSFHQVQEKEANSDLPSNFDPVPVAFYPGIPGQLDVFKSLKWRTKGNKVPVDSILTIERSIPLLPNHSKYPILALSLVLCLISFCTAGYLSHRLKTLSDSENLDLDIFRSEKFNLTIFFGNISSTIFIIIMTIVDYPSPVSCSVASVFLIFSQWIMNLSILGKFDIARAIWKRTKDLNKVRVALQMTSRRNISEASSRAATRADNRNSSNHLSPKHLQISLVAILTMLFTLMAIIWFIMDPMKSMKVFIRSQMNEEDDIFIEEHSQTCTPSQSTFKAFLAVFASTFALLLLRLVQISFTTKHIKSKIIPEIVALRVISCISITLSLFGTATIVLLFANNPIQYLISSLILALIILIVNVSFQVYSTLHK